MRCLAITTTPSSPPPSRATAPMSRHHRCRRRRRALGITTGASTLYFDWHFNFCRVSVHSAYTRLCDNTNNCHNKIINFKQLSHKLSNKATNVVVFVRLLFCCSVFLSCAQNETVQFCAVFISFVFLLSLYLVVFFFVSSFIYSGTASASAWHMHAEEMATNRLQIEMVKW